MILTVHKSELLVGDRVLHWRVPGLGRWMNPDPFVVIALEVDQFGLNVLVERRDERRDERWTFSGSQELDMLLEVEREDVYANPESAARLRAYLEKLIT